MIRAVLIAALLQPLTAPLRILDRGPQSLIATERLVVARDDGEWSRLWAAHAPTRPRPPVNFATEMVVGVFAGTRPTAGYAVEIAGWREAAGVVVVGYREAAPGRDLMTAQVLTSPYELVTIPQHAGQLTFERVER
jgi:hypothetical protein